MKKAVFTLASLAILMVAGCKEDKTKTEKVIIEKQVETQVETPAEAPTKESDGTSLSIDNKGVEFSTKDGENKTEVNINK